MKIYITSGIFNRAVYHTAELSNKESWVKLMEKASSLNVDPIAKLNGVCFGFMGVDNTGQVPLTNPWITKCSALVFDFDSCGEFETPGSFLYYIKSVVDGYFFVWWETWGSRRVIPDKYDGRIRLRIVVPLIESLPIREHKLIWDRWKERFEFLTIKTTVENKTTNGSPVGMFPPNWLYLDPTSSEPSRLHAGPGWTRQWGIVEGMPFDPGAAWADLSPAAGAASNAGADTDIPNIIPLIQEDISADRGSPLTLLLESGQEVVATELDQLQIRNLSRPGEDKLRCRCPKAPKSGSYSAFAHMHHGILYITCTSQKHKHMPGLTWPLLQGSFDYQIPKPYGITPKGVLVKALGRQRNKSKVVYDSISFTAPKITAIYQDSESNDEWWNIQWKEIGSGVDKNVTLRRDDLGSATKLSEKAGRLGLDVNETNKKEITKFFSESLAANSKTIPRQIMSQRLGWFNDSEGAPVGFMLGTNWLSGTIGMQPHSLIIPQQDKASQIAKAIRTRGDFITWGETFRALALRYPLPCIAVYTAVASILNARIGILPTVLEYGCVTGTGKSVSSEFAATAWGHPKELHTGWDGTPVDLERLAAFSCNLPLFKDDTKTVGKSKNSVDPEWAIYRIVSGEGRGRATATGMERQRKWALNMITTGEEPIYATGQSGGSRARLISIQDPPFELRTKGKVSEVVSQYAQGFFSNYGHLGPRVLIQVMRTGDDKLKDFHSQRRIHWAGVLSKHSVSDRVSSHIAALELAGRFTYKILNEAGIELPREVLTAHLETLCAHMVEVDIASGVVDPIERSFKDFYPWCLSHRGSFWTASTGANKGSDISRAPFTGWLGRWDNGERWTEIYFNKNALGRFLRDSGYHENPNALLSQWGKMGYLSAGTERIQHSVKVAGANDWCYKIERRMIEVTGKPHGKEDE